ncbi:hypothetical protein [Streptomyces sp. NPDC018031]|uniref:hypothetical protein n=1 Tax=Streptomyces sp. NPDC018031 TaxID=3365033 RepID=UPI00379F790C
MDTRDELLIDLINRAEMERSGPRLAVLTHGAVITGRIAAQRDWAVEVAARLRDSDPLVERFAEDFDGEAAGPRDCPPAFLHLRDCQLVSGEWTLPAAFGEFFRVPLSAISAWSAR